MSRRINLTRIHAINWYGYRDSIDVRGNLLIAGVTGSGKSVLMDLLQLVLVGDRRSKYNQSATGAASTRSLKGYCLGDTKQDIDGTPQYMRERSSITYVALELTWPNQKRVETWGLRIEFESAAREEPNRKNGFFVPSPLTRADFLNAQRQPLDFIAFRELVQRLDGRIFETMEQYRQEMSLPTRLNFDRGTLDYLLPAAMSFTFLRSFNVFCKEYILPSDSVDIQPVKDSYQAFLNLERELGFLRDQLQRLEAIQELDRKQTEAVRDRAVTRFLEAEFRRDDLAEDLAEKTRGVESLETELARETSRLTELDSLISDARTQEDRLKSVLRESDEGRLFLHLKGENERLAAEVNRLREIGSTVAQAVQARCSAARLWLAKIQALPFPTSDINLDRVELATEQLSSASSVQIREQTRDLVQAIHAVKSRIRGAAQTFFDQDQSLRREQQGLQEALQALALGALTGNNTLLNTLNANLPRHGRENPAQALWQLCEITDEKWRPAIEVAFTRKFAVVVSAEHYDVAEKIYHELRQEARSESLINPRQALEMPHRVQPESLAEKIQTDHPVARAVVDQLFGDLVCVERREELRKYPRAILPDGFMARRPFVERRRQYDNRPCIGQRGLEKQKVFLQQRIEELRTEQRRLSPMLEAVRELEEFAWKRNLESESIHDDLAEAIRLPESEKRLQDNILLLKQIRDAGIEEKESRLVEIQNRLREFEHEQKELLRSPKQMQLQQMLREKQSLTERLNKAEEAFQQVLAETDVSPFVARLEELRGDLAREFPVKAAAAQQCHELCHQCDLEAVRLRETIVRERQALAMAHAVFQEFDAQTDANEKYDERLEKIRASDIPLYEEKARREQVNWQHLFRTQVLEKIRAAIFEMENLVALLNEELKAPIGNDRYQIRRRPNPDHEYDVYRKLLDAAALAKENELFFASVDPEVRETVEDLFQKLIQQPDSKEATAFLDYRNYHEYDMEVTDIRDPDGRPSSVNRHSGKFSGGENQSPYFIAILACYMRAYRRYERRRRDPSLALVPIDEAFSKLSGDRIQDCIQAMRTLDLQGVFSMSSGNIPYAIDMCDQVLTLSQQERTVGRKKDIRNIAVSLTREEALRRFGGKGA